MTRKADTIQSETASQTFAKRPLARRLWARSGLDAVRTLRLLLLLGLVAFWVLLLRAMF